MVGLAESTAPPPAPSIIGDDAFLGRNRYRLTLSITGRIRFLSHLETVDTILGAIRRSGVRIQLSEGMKPKPLIKVAMPRPVAVEALGDLVEVELTEPIEPDVFAQQLRDALPLGLGLERLEAMQPDERSAASRVLGATFTLRYPDVDQARAASWAAGWASAMTLVVQRHSPKQNRPVDVRDYVEAITVSELPEGGSAVTYEAPLRDDGSVKPDEVVRVIAQLDGSTIGPASIVREGISIAPHGQGRRALAAHVGADVDEGPEKPWGSC